MSLSLFSLQGRRALVTGSGQGIGFALAQGLGLAGASVVLNGRDRAKLDNAAESLRAQGIEVAVAAFDVTDHGAVVEGVRAASSGMLGRSISWSTMPASSGGRRWRTSRWRRGMR